MSNACKKRGKCEKANKTEDMLESIDLCCLEVKIFGMKYRLSYESVAKNKVAVKRGIKRK